MITRLSHTTIYVTDQEAALRFYTDTLGFKVRTDVTMDNGFRWTTIGLDAQPDLEIVLMEPKAGPMFDQQTIERLVRRVVEREGSQVDLAIPSLQQLEIRPELLGLSGGQLQPGPPAAPGQSSLELFARQGCAAVRFRKTEMTATAAGVTPGTRSA